MPACRKFVYRPRRLNAPPICRTRLRPPRRPPNRRQKLLFGMSLTAFFIWLVCLAAMALIAVVNDRWTESRLRGIAACFVD